MSNPTSPAARPRLSVVIATYNRARMARQCVLAAWEQTYKPDEIVISDDCSKDDTIATLEQLRAAVPILKIVSTGRNTGGVPNWNHVINSSNGDLIAWCSDDDRFKPDHLEKAMDYLIRHPDVDLVHAGFDEVWEDADGAICETRTTLKSMTPVEVSRDTVIDFMRENYSWPFHPSTLVFWRRLWERTGEFDPIFGIADTDWFIRAGGRHRMVYLPYVGVTNRRHFGMAGNWSNRIGSIKMQQEFYEMVRRFVVLARLEEPRIPDLERQWSRWVWRYRRLLARIFIARCRAGNRPVARDCAAEMKAVTPWLGVVPDGLLRLGADVSVALLGTLQRVLPGGRRKYETLGKYVPM